ncbi:superoxide dismutase [Fe], chloroplastic [Lotus japonicus]|uniref:superoxide dismutase n=1 Tax=Lotus japonicus TaxID=34305 RepID=Q53D73_LOTJA|nr:superoxide dismutase [Fe], chloroplastic [Lotus japonicus]AAS92464.1 Fe-superoxide dismutase 1 precursor [Lotus japonicus]AAS92465.1 Fe-superoxide dismutase 1 precursor [Lotus japonicus]
MKLLSPSTSTTCYLSSSPSAFLPRHSHGFQNLGSAGTFKFSKKQRRCVRKAGPTEISAKFELKPPPYPMNALEPIMSQETFNYHWGKHHRAYVDNLNKQIEGTDLDGKSLEELIVIAYNKGDMLPSFNNAAQAWNHEFFWDSMKPGGGGKPSGDLLKLIERDFGSFEKFVDEFKTAAATQFGSGWAWLAYKENRLDVGNAINPLASDEDKKLVVVKTPNAVNPLVWGYYPLLTIDVWEHAYYLDYQNRRPDFISVFIDKLVSWEAVSSRLEQAKAIVAEKEREDERRRTEEEEKSTIRETPHEIFPDNDSD